MGRIEEALAKLQSRAAASKSDDRAHATLSAAQEPIKASVPRSYSGRTIEVNLVALVGEGLLAADVGGSRRLLDEYRALKRAVLKTAEPGAALPVPRANLVQIVSALPGEGKTFTSLNLAMSIAKEQDWSVVLVDGDCRNSRLSRLFGIEREPGFMGVLRGAVKDFDAAVMPTTVPNLFLMAAGGAEEDSAELLSSASMDALCAEIAAVDTRRIVVFDSPPLLLTSEAPSIARHVGQILVVVHADKTPQRAVMSALALLDPNKPIGLVLNQASAGARDVGGAFGGPYDYSYGPPSTEG